MSPVGEPVRALSVVIEADGGSRGNPGPAGYGAVVFDAATGQVLAERLEYLGVATNNVAEYRGLIAGLYAATELGAHTVSVRMDSKLVIEQLSGRWQVKHPSMRPLAREASGLLAGFQATSLQWIPRELNKHADRLANQAMDAAAGKTGAVGGGGNPSRGERALVLVPETLAPVALWADSPAVADASESAAAQLPTATPTAWTPPAGAPTRLILVRHGSTIHSPQRRYSGRNELPLSELGRQQALALAARADEFGEIAAVISSPLARAKATAQAIADALSLPVQIRAGLVEADFGAWEGFTGPEVKQQWPAEFGAWLGSVETAAPGGESFAAVARRVRRVRDEIIADYPGQAVVVVSHVTPIKILLTAALEAPLSSIFRLYLDTASVSITDYHPDGVSSVRLMNDTGHLAPVRAQ